VFVPKPKKAKKAPKGKTATGEEEEWFPEPERSTIETKYGILPEEVLDKFVNIRG
jgi:hypothetical protein